MEAECSKLALVGVGDREGNHENVNGSSSSSDDKSLVSSVQLQPMEVETFVAQDIPSSGCESGICGLYNLGNTCYMNSALQCLLHDESLKEYFNLESKNLRVGEGLLHEFIELYNKYWNGQWASIVPRKFKNHLGLTHTQFEGFGQHDGQEFLALFLASLHQELKKENDLKQNTDETSSENNSCKTMSTAEEKNTKRKRASSVIDDNLPNNKRIDSSPTVNKQYLTLTSFIGKEKKTANVNVLSSDVECDEEITTDHSNKFPQVEVSRLNSDVVIGDSEMNNQSEQRKNSVEGGNFVEQIKDLKLKHLKEPNYKETNVIADIKRHAEKDNFDDDFENEKNLMEKMSPDDVHESSFCSAMQTLLPFWEKGIKMTTSTYNCSPILKTVLSNKIDKLASTPAKLEMAELECLESDSANTSQCFSLKSDPLLPKKIFSLSKTGKLSYVKQALKVDDDDVTCSKNLPVNCHDEDDASDAEDVSDGKSSLVKKLTNILMEETDVCSNNTTEMTDANEDLQEHASNIRGDICGNSVQKNNSLADEIWMKYIQQNQSVVVDTFQGQMESTVSCCQCGHKSTTYEPFMYLSLPVPHALQRVLNIRVVPLHGEPSQHSVYVLREGRVQDLRDALALKLNENKSDVDLSSYSFCEVKDMSVRKVLENTMIVKTLNTTSRHIDAIEVLDAVGEDNDESHNHCESSWNSCCICLEDLSDPELLRHNTDSCSVLICQTCLQTSTEHYGIDGFTCPMCHAKCSPANDFVQLANSSQKRDVVVSVSFVCIDDDESVKFVAPPSVLRTSTMLKYDKLSALVQQLIPPSLSRCSNYDIVFTSLDGALCSRCEITSVCNGCQIVAMGDDDVTLQPGDNICVRFSKHYALHKSLPNVASKTEEAIQSPLTLEMCLHAFTKNEILDDSNPWYCPLCESNQNAEKRLRVCRWPDTLIVYIKRFLYHSKTAMKVDDEVLFPQELFNPGILSGTEAIHSKTYDLNACVSHHGGVYSGHYTSYCKHPITGKWHLYNDENVSAHEPSRKDSSGAYVLFYKQRIGNITNNQLC